MKIKIEMQYNNNTSCSEIDYNEFSIEKLNQCISTIPNIKPKLESFQEEEQNNKFSIMKFYYTNLAKKTDKITIKVIPMFDVLEAIVKR